MKRVLLFLCVALFGSLAAQTQPNANPEPNKDPAQKAATSPSQDTDKTKTDSDQVGTKQDKHHIRWHIAPSISLGYEHLSGPAFFNPFYPYGFYPYGIYPADFIYGGYGAFPLGYSPFYGPYFYPPYAFDYRAGRGQIKLSGAPKDAQVYLDGAYAGTADHLKKIWLDPGAYNLEVSENDGQKFQKRIYVLSGKSLKIDAKLSKPEKSK